MLRGIIPENVLESAVLGLRMEGESESHDSRFMGDFGERVGRKMWLMNVLNAVRCATVEETLMIACSTFQDIRIVAFIGRYANQTTKIQTMTIWKINSLFPPPGLKQAWVKAV